MEQVVDRVFGRRDPRLVGVRFMDSPAGVLALSVVYLVFVLRVGPDRMRARKPINVIPYVRAFNVFQVIANLIFLPIFLYYSQYRLRYSPICQKPDFDEHNEDLVRLVYAGCGYLCVRLADYLDTVFFVLAKKNSHITFLHVYHHVLIALGGWLFLRQGWIFNGMLGLALNMSVHVVMYTYYLLATYPAMKPHLGWKRYITRMQLTQFFIMFGQGVYIARHKTYCWVSKPTVVFGFSNVIIFITLFGHFYWKTYMRQSGSKSPNHTGETKGNAKLHQM